MHPTQSVWHCIHASGMESSPSRYVYNTLLKAYWTLEKRAWNDYKNQRIKEFTVTLYLLVMSETTFIKPQQHDYLKMNWKRTIVGLLKWMGKAHKYTVLHQELQTTRRSRGKKKCSGKSTPADFWHKLSNVPNELRLLFCNKSFLSASGSLISLIGNRKNLYYFQKHHNVIKASNDLSTLFR